MQVTDQRFEKGKLVVATGFRALGLNTIAKDIEREKDLELLRRYAFCAIKLLAREEAWEQFDDILATGLATGLL